MKRANIIETDLSFVKPLSKRDTTYMIVIHHTGNPQDDDLSAAAIHRSHIAQDWAGIGYHFVIRKNGDIERGRPEWAVGSHAYGENSHTVGIHVCGNFEIATPTEAQIEKCAMLCATICNDYDIPIDRQHIVGHRELMATACPGANLYAQMDTISGKANWYRYGSPEEQAQQKEIAWQKDLQEIQKELNVSDSDTPDIEKIATLARKYESNGDPGAVSSGAGDIGGVSYGLYQLASNVGSVDEFVAWLCEYPDPALANYGTVLAAHKVNTPAFIRQWKDLAEIDPGNFGRLQDEYMMERYYGIATNKLKDVYYNIENHSTAMKAVLLSRAVQNGASGAVKLFENAQRDLIGYPNLSYVDDYHFDQKMIEAIYGYLIRECELAAWNGKMYQSPNKFCHGSGEVIAGLKNRFVREKNDALNMLGM